jgi:hypothetical protein
LFNDLRQNHYLERYRVVDGYYVPLIGGQLHQKKMPPSLDGQEGQEVTVQRHRAHPMTPTCYAAPGPVQNVGNHRGDLGDSVLGSALEKRLILRR